MLDRELKRKRVTAAASNQAWQRSTGWRPAHRETPLRGFAVPPWCALDIAQMTRRAASRLPAALGTAEKAGVRQGAGSCLRPGEALSVSDR